jgi:hypothetical protein
MPTLPKTVSATASFAAGDILEDDLDRILETYGAQSSTLSLLTEYFAGEKDGSLNLSHLKKQLRQRCVKLSAERRKAIARKAAAFRWARYKAEQTIALKEYRLSGVTGWTRQWQEPFANR